MKKQTLTLSRRQQAEALFQNARSSQATFWTDLYQLEQLLGIEIDGTDDFAETSLDLILSSR